MTSLVQTERDALCDTFLRVGPDAPTLCSPWLTRDLAAHLVVRDGRPDAAVARLLPVLSGHLDAVSRSYAERPWTELVDLVRSGPPRWSPAHLGPLDSAVNLSELFIHHEDVLRAVPGFSRRQLSEELSAGLWQGLARAGRLLLRRSPVGVVIEAPGRGRREVRKATDRGSVVLKGDPAELVLYVSGRQRVAEAVLDGPPAAAAAFAASPPRGI